MVMRTPRAALLGWGCSEQNTMCYSIPPALHGTSWPQHIGWGVCQVGRDAGFITGCYYQRGFNPQVLPGMCVSQLCADSPRCPNNPVCTHANEKDPRVTAKVLGLGNTNTCMKKYDAPVSDRPTAHTVTITALVLTQDDPTRSLAHFFRSPLAAGSELSG